MTLYVQQPDGSFTVASQEEIAAATAAPDPTPAPSVTPSETPETPSEPSETPSGESGEATTSEQVAPDGTNYGSGQIDAQPEDAPAPVPPAADAPAQYQEGKIDNPDDLPSLTQEQAETQYPEPAAPAEAPDTEGL